jgi:outer membrane protein
MRLTPILFSGMFTLLSAALVSAQTAQMTLSDCIQYALDKNPQMQVANLQIKDAEWRIKENLATGLPQVTAGLSYTGFIQRGGLPSSALSFGPSGDPAPPPSAVTNSFSTAQVEGLYALLGSVFASDPDSKVFFSPVHSVSGTAQASQLIFNNSYLQAKKAARYYRDYVMEQAAVTRQTLRNQVTDAYLPALLISESLKNLDKNIGNLEKLLADTRAINQAGFAEQLDVDRLELSLSTLRSEWSSLARQREIVVNYLKLAMGMNASTAIDPSDDISKLLGQYGDADLSTPVNFMNRPEYLQLLKGRDLSGLQVDLFRKPFLPTVAGFVQWQGALQGGFGDKISASFKDWFFIPSTVAGLSVNFTLWDGGGNKSKKERAMIGVMTVESQKQLLENAILTEVENARKQYMNAQDRVKNAENNLKLAERIHDTTQKKYRAGIGSSFEITQSESGLYAAQQSQMQAQFDLLTAKVAIKKALGGQ